VVKLVTTNVSVLQFNGSFLLMRVHHVRGYTYIHGHDVQVLAVSWEKISSQLISIWTVRFRKGYSLEPVNSRYFV